MERYKTEILTVEGFYEARPDMSVHTETTIQSAIYQSASMLDAKCGGIINKVWNYNNPEGGTPKPDPTNWLYRTPEQLAYIKEAFINQTQYTINLGNDYTQGGSSFSMGNVNASYSRPEKRDLLAPMVEFLLQQARVLDLQSFFKDTPQDSCSDLLPEEQYDMCCLTKNYADKEYLHQYQPDGNEGQVATLNNAKIITFDTIQNLVDKQNVGMKTIYDPLSQVYKQINEFPISYWNGLTKEEIYNAIVAAGTVWQPDFIYRKDFVVLYEINVEGKTGYGYAKSKIDNNIGHNPNTSPNQWEILPTSPVELQAVIDYVINYINTLPQIQYVSEGNGELITFNSDSDFQAYKTTMGVDDSYFQNVNDNTAKIDQENTFTANQNISAELKVGNPTSNRLQMWNFDYSNNNYSAFKFIKGENTNLLQIQVNNNTNEASISSPSGTLKIENLANPTNNNDAVNKQYVDSNSISPNQVNTFTQTQNFDRIIEIGQPDGDQAYILPRKREGKTTLRLGNSPGNDNKRYDIDLENRTKILNVPNPTANGDVANKAYVDSKTSGNFVSVDTTQTITGQKTFTNQTKFICENDQAPIYFYSNSSQQFPKGRIGFSSFYDRLVIQYESSSESSKPFYFGDETGDGLTVLRKIDADTMYSQTKVSNSSIATSALTYVNGFANQGARTKIYKYNFKTNKNLSAREITNIVFENQGGIWLEMSSTWFANENEVYLYFRRPDSSSDFTPTGWIWYSHIDNVNSPRMLNIEDKEPITGKPIGEPEYDS